MIINNYFHFFKFFNLNPMTIHLKKNYICKVILFKGICKGYFNELTCNTTDPSSYFT